MFARRREGKRSVAKWVPVHVTPLNGEEGWSNMPAEINMLIFSFLCHDPKTLCTLDQVASWLRPFSSSDEFWFEIVSSHPKWGGLLLQPNVQ